MHVGGQHENTLPQWIYRCSFNTNRWPVSAVRSNNRCSYLIISRVFKPYKCSQCAYRTSRYWKLSLTSARGVLTASGLVLRGAVCIFIEYPSDLFRLYSVDGTYRYLCFARSVVNYCPFDSVFT